MYSSPIQQKRAARLRKKRRRGTFKPMDAHKVKNPRHKWQFKEHCKRRHRSQKSYSWGGRWRNNSHNWS